MTRFLTALLIVAALFGSAICRDDVLVNEHGHDEQDNDIEVRYDDAAPDQEDPASFSNFEFRESQASVEPEHILAEADDITSDDVSSSWVTPHLRDMVQGSDAVLLETRASALAANARSAVFRSLHARTRHASRSYSKIGPSGSGSTSSSVTPVTSGSGASILSQSAVATGSSSSGSDASLSSSISPSSMSGSQSFPSTNADGIVNTGETRIHSDREGHHFIVLTNNNVLAQTVPDTAQQILAAAAAQAVAKQILDMARRRSVVQSQVVQEATSKSQIQSQSSQQLAVQQQSAQQSVQEQGEKSDEQGKKRLIITLQDPWTPYGDSFQDPKATRIDTLCIVEGQVRGPDGLIGVLGADCRPLGRLAFPLIRTNNLTRVDIMPDGRMYVIAGGDKGWLSLNGISFTVGSDKDLRLLDKWIPMGNGFRPPTVSKIGDLCVVSGLIQTPTTSWQKGLASVDMECFSTSRLIFGASNHDKISQVDLLPSGQLAWQAGGADHGWVSLDGIAWCVQDGGVPFDLDAQGGWSAMGGEYRRPRYCMIQGYCILSGVIQNKQDWNGLITTLPAACRPSHQAVFGVNTRVTQSRIDVFPNGQVRYQTNKPTNWPWLSLDGIRFMTTSAPTGSSSGSSSSSASVGSSSGSLSRSGSSASTSTASFAPSSSSAPPVASTVSQPSGAAATKP